MDEDVAPLDDDAGRVCVRATRTRRRPNEKRIWQRQFKRRQHFRLLLLLLLISSSSHLHHSVRARIVSFGGALAVPWKTYLVLDCLHVGEPAPSIQWQHEGAAIQENSKYQVRNGRR